MTITEPRPCPFCGVEMIFEAGGLRKNQFESRPAIRHPKNDCLLSGYGWGRASHIERWNRRDDPMGDT